MTDARTSLTQSEIDTCFTVAALWPVMEPEDIFRHAIQGTFQLLCSCPQCRLSPYPRAEDCRGPTITLIAKLR